MCFLFLPVELSVATIYLRKTIILEKVKDNFNFISCSLVDPLTNIPNYPVTKELAEYQWIIKLRVLEPYYHPSNLDSRSFPL
jgi:hypothetical protein